MALVWNLEYLLGECINPLPVFICKRDIDLRPLPYQAGTDRREPPNLFIS